MAIDEQLVRAAAVQYVHATRDLDGLVTWSQLRSFTWEGASIDLIGTPGIWKPKAMSAALSITTSHKDPYGDIVGDDGLLEYHYFAGDPGHHYNVQLRDAFRRGLPLLYFRGVSKGVYVGLAPVVVVNDDPVARLFTVACDDIDLVRPDLPLNVTEEIRRSYTTTLTMKRAHQLRFRRSVLAAYSETCAVCRLRIRGLLDAAHIVPDGHPELGQPVVPNGLSLCKIHHAAFDQNIVGIRPDSTVEVNAEVLEEKDGPMLLHGIQEVHGRKLYVPRARDKKPDPARLELRYEEFRRAG